MGIFLGIVLILLLLLIVVCSCKVASWVEQDTDDLLERRTNEKENLYSDNRK